MGPGDNLATPGGQSIFSDLTAKVIALPTSSTGNVSHESQVAQGTPAIKKLDNVHSSITKMKDPLDDSNWVVWRERIRRIFHLCGVEPYIYGKLKRPNPAVDQATFDLWDYNDVYAQILITNNISKGQMVHVTRLNTAHEIWKSLEAIHETKDYQIAITIQHALFRKCASEDDDIIEHLAELKKQNGLMSWKTPTSASRISSSRRLSHCLSLHPGMSSLNHMWDVESVLLNRTPRNSQAHKSLLGFSKKNS
jgi:hypothetical protein